MSSRTKLINFAALAFGLALSLLGANAAWANPTQELAMGVQRPKGVVIPWDFFTSYTIRSDFNAPERPRMYNHRFEFGASQTFLEKYTALFSMGVQYVSLDNAIVRNNPKDSYFRWNDMTATVFRNYRTQDLHHSFTFLAATDILLSNESRYMGYRSVNSGQIVYSWSPSKWLSWMSTTSIGHVWNRYKYAPAAAGGINRGDINQDFYYGFSTGPVLTLTKGLRLITSVGVRGTHYLDGSQLHGFGNSFSLTYVKGEWTVFARYLNSGYAERGDTNLWFVDNYRQLATAGAVFNF